MHGNAEKFIDCVTSDFLAFISENKGPESPVFTLTGPGLVPETGLLKTKNFY